MDTGRLHDSFEYMVTEKFYRIGAESVLLMTTNSQHTDCLLSYMEWN